MLLQLKLPPCLVVTITPCTYAGMAPRYPLHQRIALMQLVRTLLADRLLAYHLFATYDLAAERKLDAVQVRSAQHICGSPSTPCVRSTCRLVLLPGCLDACS